MMCDMHGSKDLRIEETTFTELFTQNIQDKKGLKQ